MAAQVLDAALTRPGRLSRRVIVPLPDEAGRADIMAVHLRNTPMASAESKVLLQLALSQIKATSTVSKRQTCLPGRQLCTEPLSVSVVPQILLPCCALSLGTASQNRA